MKLGKRMAGAGLAAFLGTGACLSGAIIAGGISVSTVYAGSGIAINSDNFPDKNFRLYILDKIDKNKNYTVDSSEIEKCEVIDVSTENIYTLKGIEHFKKLKELYCDNNNLTSLNVSKNIELETLDCNYNNLKSLNVSKNTSLEILSCQNNNLTSLDVSKNHTLIWMACDHNEISKLDISKNNILFWLTCSNTEIKNLDVSKNIILGYLGCEWDKVDTITIKKGSEFLLEYPYALLTSTAYSSSNSKVVSVNSDGTVKGLKQGVATLGATKYIDKKKTKVKIRVLFDDVRTGNTFYNPVYWAADNGVTYGVAGTNNFAPNKKVTRGQVIAFLYRMGGNPNTKGIKNVFKDVTKKSTFYNPILWGGKSKVVSGYSDGTFREKGTCTRGQIVAFIWRMAGKPEPKTKKSKFKDVNKKNTFYKAILWAAEKGITVGYDDGTFRSGGNCTRGQMVAFLQRFAKQYPSKVKL